MYKREDMVDADRFNPERPNLCENLRWKGMFIWAEKDDTVPPSNTGAYWCFHSQNCMGPDGKLAEPGECDSSTRKCHNSSVKAAELIKLETWATAA
ncbi:MAG TPA: hypothetical protein VFZ34_29350 [Blastocatellia bacterium]|nr:hypothetical protein [Blastocatellia bacterium]